MLWPRESYRALLRDQIAKRMPFVVKANEIPRPVDVGLVRAQAVMRIAQAFA